MVDWQIKKDPDLKPSPPNHANFSLKMFRMALSISWSDFMAKLFTIQKIYSKMYSTSFANTLHDVTAFETAGMV